MMTMLPSMRGKAGLAQTGLALAAVCLALAACERGDGTSSASLEQSIAAPHSDMMALAGTQAATGLAEAVASLPPEAGAVASVRAHAYVDGYRQDILLQGSPLARVRNSITVLARTSSKPTLDEATPLTKPAEAGIRSELGAQFPKIAMQVVERSSGNAYGPYGLALGRAEGDVRCLYMWQWIDANRLPPDAGVAGPASVRVRLCQKGTTFDAMAALVDHLSIHAATTVAASDGAGIVDAPTAEAAKPARRRKHAARHRRVVEAPSDVAAAAPLAPVAPPPAAAPALAMDLPPQALQGPKSTSSAAKPN